MTARRIFTATGAGYEIRVNATDAELAEYQSKHGRRPGVYRVVCRLCGKRLWGSGMGLGSHRRSCNGAHVRLGSLDRVVLNESLALHGLAPYPDDTELVVR